MAQANQRKRAAAEEAQTSHGAARKKAKWTHRMAQQRDARSLLSQTTSKALKNGELDVDKFVKAREYEVRALEDGLLRSKKGQNRRAHQQVPRDLRRRTASHNVKRIPKRLQARGRVEMAEDDTPTVTARRRKPTRHMRLRIENAKRLRALGAQRSRGLAPRLKNGTPKKVDIDGESHQKLEKPLKEVRPLKTKNAALADPPLSKAKFRKRQQQKSWIPTHMFHAKRAHMSPPKEPLWRFAIPLSPTAKCYRPTHRAASERGAVAWDTSYFATIRLQGRQRSIEAVLAAMNVKCCHDVEYARSKESVKWRNGTRAWQGLASGRESPHKFIAPVTIIWSVIDQTSKSSSNAELDSRSRSVLVRMHPAAFTEIWEELIRSAKVAKPQVMVEDLRYEIGSIEITGPGSTEALLGALWPSMPEHGSKVSAVGSVEHSWKMLSGLTNLAMLPPNALLAFNTQDPRLHHPPRTIHVPTTTEENAALLNLLAAWPVDTTQKPPALFSRQSRLSASSRLPSQKSINRRKALAVPGQYPAVVPTDPTIPVILYTLSTSGQAQSKWTLLLPWKCVQPVWYSIMYYPLSTGMQPRFGGLEQQRQLAFEQGLPWFPGDFPGTQAGWQWELAERQKRLEAWKRKPKSKRVNWDALDLGQEQKGEIGKGWACDWERLVSGSCEEISMNPEVNIAPDLVESLKQPSHTPVLQVAPLPATPSSTTAHNSLVIVRITLLTRGVPQSCARVYRLPATGSLRHRWLALDPNIQRSRKRRGNKSSLPRISENMPAYLVQRRLAQSLLQAPRASENAFPVCPRESDLIGFVTTGNFNLGEGRGSGIGNVLVSELFAQMKEKDPTTSLCVVRNAGSNIGRLARWDRI